MASSSSSSGSGPIAPRKYHVFVSFRGRTRNNFTSHLYAALERDSIVAFCDDKHIKKGYEIAPALIQAIKNSSVSIIVFSKHYACSSWCLNELAQIMQYRKDEGHFVIPIFYKVDPSHVRSQTGAYEMPCKDHEKRFKSDPDRLKRWRAALSEAGNLCGWCYQTSMKEANFIQKIVADVKTKLEHKVKGLNHRNSVQLSIHKAFRSDHAEDGYDQLIKDFVDYTKCNPMAFVFFDSNVHSKDKKLWDDDLLRKLLAGNPNDEIQKVLRLSYDRLNDEVKQSFRDNMSLFLRIEDTNVNK